MLKFSISATIILLAIGVFAYKYWDYVINPWTRDGQVRAQVIQITPRVSGPIVNLEVKDNQLVKTGDMLFEIDPRTFKTALEQAQANLEHTRDSLLSLAKQVDAAKAVVAASDATVKQVESSISALVAVVLESKQELGRQKELQKGGATSTRSVERAQANHDVNFNNQQKAEGELLQMKASYEQTRAELAKAEADLGAQGDANALLRAAKASVRDAELNLEFTQVKAPVDGYVTNLNLRLGSQGVANEPALALVDINSYWIHGYFRENWIENVHPGDHAVVTLMTYPDKPLRGRVDSLGWGIAQQDGSTGFDLLPTISPTFEWIRLAQRVPVRIHLDEVPDGIALRVGTTASVLVMTGTAGQGLAGDPAPAPRVLQ